MKKIFVNGKEIGEIEATGDPLQDMLSAEKLIKEKGLWREPDLCDSMFKQAFSFSSIARKINHDGLRESPIDSNSITPFIVNAAFSIEVYLKSIHMLFGQKLTGHALVTLFNKLPDEAKSVIDQKVSELIKEYNFSNSFEFEKELENINRAFEQWRYVYEKSDLDFIHITSVIFIMNVLHEAFEQIRKTE